MHDVVIATQNPGKFLEICEGLKGLPLNLLPSPTLMEKQGPVEDGDSYLQNAINKAGAFAEACNSIVVADDSGLEVDALGGRPGLFSSRYSGKGDQNNLKKIIEELRNIPWQNRGACFRCVLVVVTRSGRILSIEGECRGVIAFIPRGENGFGYDSLFYHPSIFQTFGECSPEVKMTISHRGKALQRLRHELPDFLSES